MRIPRRRLQSRAVFGLFLIASIFLLLRFNSVDDLEAKSSAIAPSLAANPEPRWWSVKPNWFWLSNVELIKVSQFRPIHGSMIGSPPGGVATADIIDIQTRKSRRNQSLEYRLNNDHRFREAELESISPDGKWFLTGPYTTYPTQSRAAVRWDGEEVREWQKPAAGMQNPAIWFPDSRGWVRLRNSNQGFTHAEIHSLEKPADVKVVTLAQSDVGGSLLGCRTDGRLQVGMWRENVSTGKSHFGVIDIGQAGTKPALFALELFGANCKVWGIAMNPKGDRLSWFVLRAPDNSWLTQLLRRIGAGSARYGRVELWTTGIDGQNKRLIAACSAFPGDATVQEMQSSWSPDGKRLLFTLHNAVRTINLN